MDDAIQVLLVLSVPFLFGVAVGREFRRETLASKLGSKLIQAAKDRRVTQRFVGQGAIVTTVLTMRLENAPPVKIVLEDA